MIKKWLPLDFLILDEITAIKGFTAKRIQAGQAPRQADARSVSACPVSRWRTGPRNCSRIMEFIDPEVLGCFDKFDRTFIVRDGWGRPKRYRNLHLIQKRLGEAMYRKSREDIAEWLPEKIEIEMPVVLDRTTMRLHDLIRDDLPTPSTRRWLAVQSAAASTSAAHYGRYADARTAR